MVRPGYYRQRRLEQARTCLTCGVVLPLERRGYYCAVHGHEERPATEVLMTTCRGCGRPLRGGRSLRLSCLGGVA